MWRSGQLSRITGAPIPDPGGTSEDTVTVLRGPGPQPPWRLAWVCREPRGGENPAASSLPGDLSLWKLRSLPLSPLLLLGAHC